MLVQKNDAFRAFYDFSEIALWMVSSENPSHFALINTSKNQGFYKKIFRIFLSVIQC